MANDEQLAILEKGVAAWNMWREENPEVRPRLRGADLSGAKLEGAILSGAILSRADLSGARLVKMPSTDRGTKGIEIGVNGIWSKDTNTAALMTLTPPGNSMLAANPNAVIDSLKHARRLHSLSFGLAVLGLGILLLKPEGDIAVPVFEGLTVSPTQFTLLALIVSACVLTLVKSFMGNAHDGARYLHDRQSAMTVGTFSWALSRYTGKRRGKQIQSLVTRFVMAFHPVVYIFLILFLDSEPLTWHWVLYWALGIVLLVFCTWIFIISQKFQRPMLFDRATEKAEEARQSDTQELTAAVEKQTAKLTELIDQFKPETAEPAAEPPLDS